MATSGRFVDSPRHFPAVMELIATMKRNEAERKKSSYVDRCKRQYLRQGTYHYVIARSAILIHFCVRVDSFLDGYHTIDQVTRSMNESLDRN